MASSTRGLLRAGLTALALTLTVSPTSGGTAHAEEAGRSSTMRLVVDRSERRLYVYVNGEQVQTHPVAVGKPGHTTPSGSWAIHRIDWNPDWTPPDSPWARGKSYTPPGHRNNPMGRVRMVFRAPYSIHGTDALGSLGKRASHGSIRLANDVIVELAPLLMEHGGAARSEEWIRSAKENRKEMKTVHLPRPVPITVRE